MTLQSSTLLHHSLGIDRSVMIAGALIEMLGNTDVNVLLYTMTSSMSATCAKR